MKLVWMGKYNGPEQLPKGDLPVKANKYKEPKTTFEINLVAGAYAIPVTVITIILILIKYPIVSDVLILFKMFNFGGFILGFLMILPHELLHAIIFPKDAEVGLWVVPKGLMAFVHCVEPISKWRFIFLSLLPSIIFGFIPFLVWLFMPYGYSNIHSFLLSFSIVNLLFGVGDYMNVVNTLVQVPEGAMVQLSGFHSYWYEIKKDCV